MDNNLTIKKDGNNVYIYSIVNNKQACIIEYMLGNYLTFNLDFINDGKIRTSHFKQAMARIFDHHDFIAIYNYAIKLYNRLKRRDAKLLKDGYCLRESFYAKARKNLYFKDNLNYGYNKNCQQIACDNEIEQHYNFD